MENLEFLEKRFGIIAVEKGYITAEELVDALRIQVHEDIRHGTHRIIGEILLAQGNMIPAQVEEVLKVLFNR
ncbi:MAG TPA: hypothetical protein VMW42_10245 [Desulfatiglandales bacterium]|nr:hypothetical protein [Desulfatiglandales bacterium]